MKNWLRKMLGVQDEMETMRRALTTVDAYHDQQHSTAFEYINHLTDEMIILNKTTKELFKDLQTLADTNKQLTQIILEMNNNDFK